jgi:hypothetical protein
MNVFFYGPLSFSKICEALLSKDLQTQPAVLHDYSMGQSPETGNYGVYPFPAQKIEGISVQNIRPRDVNFLNIFFDSYFEFRRVEKVTDLKGEIITKSFAWVVPTRYKESIESHEFSSNIFDRHFLNDFTEAVKTYRRSVMLEGHRKAFTFGADLKGF